MWDSLLENVVYSSAWLAAGLASLTFFVSHALSVDAGWSPAALVFASTLLIYNLDHLADTHVQESRDQRANAFMRRRGVGLVALSGLATLALFIAAPAAARWVFGAYTTVGALYGVPVVPARRGGRWVRIRLKEVAGMKGWLVGASIVTAVVGLPLAWAGAATPLLALPLALFLFIFTASNVHMFDVRDLDSDREAGVSTLPLQLGVLRTRQLLVLLNLAVSAMALVTGLAPAHPELLIGAALTISYVLSLSARTPRAVYGILVDGCFFAPILLTILHESKF